MRKIEDVKELLNLFVFFMNSITNTVMMEFCSKEELYSEVKTTMAAIEEELQEMLGSIEDWKSLTQEDCNNLRFGYLQSDEHTKKDLEELERDYQKGRISEEDYPLEKNKLCNLLHLRLIPIYLLPLIPKGLEVTCIDGNKLVYDGKNIDKDTRCGFLAYGINIE